MPNSRSSVFNLQSPDTQSAPLSLMSPMQPSRSVVMSILDSTSWIRHPPAKHGFQFRNDGVQPMGGRKLVRVAFYKARLGGARRLRLLICSRRTCRKSSVHHALTRDNRYSRISAIAKSTTAVCRDAWRRSVADYCGGWHRENDHTGPSSCMADRIGDHGAGDHRAIRL